MKYYNYYCLLTKKVYNQTTKTMGNTKLSVRHRRTMLLHMIWGSRLLGRRISKRNQKIWKTMMWGSSSPRADRGVQKALYILAFFPYSFERIIARLSQSQRSILENMLRIAMDRIKSNLCAGGLTSSMINSGLIKLTCIRSA